MASKNVERTVFPKNTYDVLFRLVLVGDSGVGKTALLLRYADNTFELSFITTIGIDFRIKTITVQGKRVKLQIWDTAGQEQFHSIASSYFRNAHGIILIYDVTSASSYMHISKWVSNISKNAPIKVKMVLIGNKCDREENLKVIGKDKGDILAKELDIPFLETSAKNDINVDTAFELITLMILEEQLPKEKKTEDNENEVVILKPRDSVSEEKRKNCCSKS